MYFELTERFCFILCYVHKCNCCNIIYNVILWNDVKYLVPLDSLWVFVLFISISDEELFSETTVGCTASLLVQIILYSRWFCIPPSSFEAAYCFICGRRKVTVARFQQKRSTEGYSKFKSPETRQVQERLVSTLEHLQVPKWDRTRCPEE